MQQEVLNRERTGIVQYYWNEILQEHDWEIEREGTSKNKAFWG